MSSFSDAQTSGKREAILPLPNLDRSLEEMNLVRQWVTERSKASALAMPDHVFHAVLRMARHLSDQLPGTMLSPTTVLPGFTLADARRLWHVVFGYAYVSRFSTVLTRSADMALLEPTVTAFVEDLSTRTGVPNDRVAAFVEFMTYRPGRHPDPAVSPFLRLKDRLLISPTLIGMSNFERNLLRLLAYDPSLYGPIGTFRGATGTDQVANFMRLIPGTDVWTNVSVKDASSNVLGDLDVVAIDPTEGIALILEVKWPAEPDSLEETAKAELEIKKGQEQSLGLQSTIGAGTAFPALPRHVPRLKDIETTWMVLCGTHQTSNKSLVTHPIVPVTWNDLWRCPTAREDLQEPTQADLAHSPRRDLGSPKAVEAAPFRRCRPSRSAEQGRRNLVAPRAT